LDTTDIVKVENFFCPIIAHSVDSLQTYEAGEYAIIPFPEEPGYAGAFTINVHSKNMDAIDFVKLPKSEKHTWKELSVQGEWREDSSGGGDILGLGWQKNPQFQLTLSRAGDAAVVLAQDDNNKSVGFYVIRHNDSHKAVEYTNEAEKTPSFKYSCSTGVKLRALAAGSYVVIPATYEPGLTGPFQLLAYTDDNDSTFAPLVNEWKFRKEIKAEWKDKTSGGSPNNDTFTNNPQFGLTVAQVDKPVHMLFQLVQEAAHFEETSIGFLVIKRAEERARVEQGQITADSVFAKPEGWAPKIDVVCSATVNPDDTRTFIIIPSTFKPEINRSFQLVVYSDDEFSMEQL